jgi:hypothetical protein
MVAEGLEKQLVQLSEQVVRELWGEGAVLNPQQQELHQQGLALVQIVFARDFLAFVPAGISKSSSCCHSSHLLVQNEKNGKFLWNHSFNSFSNEKFLGFLSESISVSTSCCQGR